MTSLQRVLAKGGGTHALSRELLALNDGLGAYRELGATMGVPLLYPWANRLSRSGFAVEKRGFRPLAPPLSGVALAHPCAKLRAA